MPDNPKIIIAVKMFCPHCGARHVDETRNGERWDHRAHTTHRCQGCGGDWDVYVSGAADGAIALKAPEGLKTPSMYKVCGGLLSYNTVHRTWVCLSCERVAVTAGTTTCVFPPK